MSIKYFIDVFSLLRFIPFLNIKHIMISIENDIHSNKTLIITDDEAIPIPLTGNAANFFFLRDFIFKKTLFKKVPY